MYRYRSLLSLLLLAAASPAQSRPGALHWGARAYVEYVEGNGPLILSMAHGGYLKPATVRNRTYGVTVQDARTQEVGRAIALAFRRAYDLHPHVIISHLHRSKLDPNRDIVEAAQGDRIAEQAWRDFHGFLAAAKAAVSRQWGRGLYLDVHGHGHPLARVEIGYLLTAADLSRSDTVLNGKTYVDKCCIRALARRNGATSFSSILRGSVSLGGLLQARGITGVPSPHYPDPGANPYFSGGYNCRQWGSRSGGSVDAIQLELPSSMRRDLGGRNRFTAALVASLGPFFQRYYAIDLRAGPRLELRASLPVATEAGESGAFELRRSGSTAAPLVVNLAIGGTARGGSDYLRLPTRVTIPAGRAAVTLKVQPLQDSLREGQETIELNLLPGPVGSPRIGAGHQATMRLLDDEADPNLAGHWSLNDGPGTFVRDSSGNQRHGQRSGGPARVAGILSGALAFDERDDRVVIPDFDYAAGNALTLSFWFRAPPSNQSSTQYFFSHGSVLAPNSLNIYRFESSNLLRTWLRCKTDISSSILLDIPTNYMDDRWYHYCLTVERGFGLASVYIDGVRQAQGRLGGDRLDPGGSIHLGARQDRSSTRFLRGTLDDVMLFSRQLSAVEVRALYHESMGRPRVFGQGCGGAVHDAQGASAPGRTLVYQVARSGAAGSGALFLGLSRSRLGAGPLPLDLALLGAPGCLLLQDLSFRVPLGFSQGRAALPVRLPADPSLRGLRFYSQALVPAPGANAAGFVVSNGVTSVVGG